MNQNTNLTRKLTAAQDTPTPQPKDASSYHSQLTRKLADAQEAHALSRAEVNPAVVYRIYTEFFPNLLDLTRRYFSGATLYFATGLYDGVTEQGGILEIVATRDDLQKIVFLAGDIKHVNTQTSVLVTSAGVTAVSV